MVLLVGIVYSHSISVGIMLGLHYFKAKLVIIDKHKSYKSVFFGGGILIRN